MAAADITDGGRTATEGIRKQEEFPEMRLAKIRKLSSDQPSSRQRFEQPYLRSLEVQPTTEVGGGDTLAWENRARDVISSWENETRRFVEEAVSADGATRRIPLAVFYGKFGTISKAGYQTLCALRTCHPALAQYQKVYYDFANNLWLVDTSSIKGTTRKHLEVPLKLAGSPVYLHYSCLIRLGMDLDPFQQVNPREMLADNVIVRLAEYFPLSVGVRVYVWGGVEVLFENQKKIEQQRKQGPWPASLLGFSYSFVVLKIKPSIDFVNAGTQVAGHANELYQARGCVGLRIRRTGDEVDEWTTTTHGWVPLRRTERYTKWGHKFLNLAANMVDRLKGYGYGRVWGRTTSSSSPIGTKVYVAGEETEMGTISACYDDLIHSKSLPFPYGFQHDLSLITKSDEEGTPMPVMQPAANLPRIRPAFANPTDALSTADVFIAHYPVLSYSALHTMKGHVVQGASRAALVDGAQYFWQRANFFAISKAIIWRSEKDDMTVRGASGSALFLGDPSQTECSAVCFQNFEQMVGNNRFWTLDTFRDTLSGNDFAASFKGGFILPADVQEATIVVEPSLERRRSVSGKNSEPEESRNSTSSRRGVSNPMS